MAVGASAWSANRQGITPAAAATAKSILSILSASNRALKLTELGVGFVGAASGSAKPVLIELCTWDKSTAGTPGGSVTPAPMDGSDAQTVQATASYGFTAEPTALTVVRVWRPHPQAGLVIQFPLGREGKSGINKGFVIRATFDSGETTLNMDAYMEFEE